MTTNPSLRQALGFAGLAVILIASSGCGLLRGSDPTRATASEFYNRYLPIVRDIPHPDSVSIDDGRSFRDLRYNWSVRHSQRFGSRHFQSSGFSTFATLWSRDLSMRSAELALGLGDLSEDVSARAMSDQMDRYEDAITFEVHMFVPAAGRYSVTDTDLRGGGVNVMLVDDRQNSYRPVRVEAGMPEEHQMMTTQPPVYYRPSVVVFDRIVEGRDILAETSSLRLVIRTAGPDTDEIWFSWRIVDQT